MASHPDRSVRTGSQGHRRSVSADRPRPARRCPGILRRRPAPDHSSAPTRSSQIPSIGGPSFFTRLRERKLVQWSLAYLAGAWLLLEVVDVLGGRLGLPDSLFLILLVGLGVGFLATIVLAWYHGEKGRQRVSGPELLIIAGLIAIGGALVMIVAPGASDPESTGEASPETLAGSSDSLAIAVLLLENLSPDPDDAFFADGLHEEIISQLARIRTLRVTSRTSVMGYRGDDRPSAREIAAELGVGTILEGSARRGGNTVRVTVQPRCRRSTSSSPVAFVSTRGSIRSARTSASRRFSIARLYLRTE